MNLLSTIRSFFRKPRSGLQAVQSARLAQVRAEQIAKIRATYDAARTTTEFSRYWANADQFDADSAHSKEVRHVLVSRSRYEMGNNGYADGIGQTYATDLVGIGPSLRMQTGSEGFNRMIEAEWYRWCKAVHFRRKLWCLAHAKHTDGEGIAVLRRNPRVRHPIPLDLVLYETEQCQTPYLPYGEPGYIDGIKFDQFGNPLWYDLLREHPGTTNSITYEFEPERVPADRVLHWFRMRRPGQHRGVPESASTLNTGAAARRWREATLAKAESQADFTLFLKTQQQPDEMEQVTPMSTLDIEKRMMTALPAGYDPYQLENNTPGASYDSFHKTLINEQARPKNMPYNKAACDSSSYNYASGRLDHQTYYASLDVEREDCNDLVLDPLFAVWFELAVERFGWLGGNFAAISPFAMSHIWDWPKHRVADVESEANANNTRLRNGSLGLAKHYSDCGEDYEDELAKDATAFGISVDELRKIRLYELHPSGAAAVLALPEPSEEAVTPRAMAAAFSALIRAFDPNQPRDERGRFGEGSGASGSSEDQREKSRQAEDDQIERERSAERGRVQSQRDREDEEVAVRQNKELRELSRRHEKEMNALEHAQEKEGRKLDSKREKEDKQIEKQKDKEWKELQERLDEEEESLTQKHYREWEESPTDENPQLAERQEREEQEHKEHRAAEERDIEERWDKEDQGREDRRNAEDDEIYEREKQEREALMDRQDEEESALRQRHQQEQDAIEERRAAEDEAREERWAKEDEAREAARDSEDEDDEEEDELEGSYPWLSSRLAGVNGHAKT